MTKEVRLFNKNLTDCKPVKARIVGDVCPVPVSETPFQGNEGQVNGGSNYNSLKVNITVALVKFGYMLEGLRIPHYHWTS